MTKVKAFDDGFGDGKYTSNGKNAYTVPSFVTRWQPIPEGEFARQDYSEPDSHITVEYDGKKHLIGKAAQALDKMGEWMGEENKHRSLKFIPLMKGQLALLCKDDVEKEVHIDPLVMGLPLNQDTEERKKELAGIVKGRHEVKVTLADGAVIDKIVYVDSIIFLTQPFGSFFYKALNDSGAIKDEALANQMTIVLDLGARTLNLLTLRGFTPISNLSETKQLGIYGAWESIKEDIKNTHMKDLPISRIPKYCKEGFISGGFNIERIRDDNYALHADEIISVVGTKFIHTKSEIDNIILTGGGSEVLRPWLEGAIKKVFPQAKVETLGRTATVKGYYNFGVRMARNNKNKKQPVTEVANKGV